MARSPGVEQRLLYRRRARRSRLLRRELTKAGIDRRQVADLLGWDRLDLNVDYGVGEERIGRTGPSHQAEGERN